mmetsp:Transcript_28254/g.40966  ORF Transcript_28254/g.40966 Transcript_28254/m.40966 type:complete len:538 (-) Transcript_28254:1771-3384(-)
MSSSSGAGQGGTAMILEDTAGLPICELAKMRWLTSDEIVSILAPESSDESQLVRGGISFLKSDPSSPPPSGSLFLFHAGAMEKDSFDIGKDGHYWIRKTDASEEEEILEDRVRLRHGGRDRLSACYVHSAKQSTFHRRTYRLIDYGEDKSDNLLLVHYLDTFVAYKVSAVFADHVSAAATKERLRGESIDAAAAGKKKSPAAAPPQSYDDGTMDILWSMVYDDAEGDDDDQEAINIPSIQEAADIAIQQHIDDALEAKLSSAVDETVMDMAAELDDEMAFVDDEDLRMAVERAMMDGEGGDEDDDNVRSANKIESALVSALEEIISPELEKKIVNTMNNVLEEEEESASVDVSAMSDNLSHSQLPPQTPLPDIVDFTPSEHCMDFVNSNTKVVLSTSAAVPLLPPDDHFHRWLMVAAFIEVQLSTNRPLFARVALSPLKRLSPFSFKCTAPQDIACPGDRVIILLGLRILDDLDEMSAVQSTAWRLAAKVCIEAEWNVAYDLSKKKESSWYHHRGSNSQSYVLRSSWRRKCSDSDSI